MDDFTKEKLKQAADLIYEILGYEEATKETPAQEPVFYSGEKRIFTTPELEGWAVISRVTPNGQTSDQHNLNESAMASLEGGEQKMPLRYDDGSFRVIRKSGLLQYRFIYNGKQVGVYGYTKQECWEKRVRYSPAKAAAKKIKNSKKEKSIETYKEWAEKWLEAYKRPNISEEYFDCIVGQLKNHIYPAFGKKRIAEIRPLEIQEFLVSIPQDNLRTKLSSVLSESFTDAFTAGIIQQNPYQGIKFKRYVTPKVGALTHTQQIKVLNYFDENFAPETKFPTFVRALLMTGMRQGELNGLQAKNIDFKNLEITVEVAYKKKTKKLGSTKSNRTRIIPMAPTLANLLKPLVDACKTPEDRIFGWDCQETTYRTLAAALKEVGLSFTGHITRHTFITNAFELGFPQYLVQEWAGHSEQLQTQNYLGLRRPTEFMETEIVNYMRELKKLTVIQIM